MSLKVLTMSFLLDMNNSTNADMSTTWIFNCISLCFTDV